MLRLDRIKPNVVNRPNVVNKPDIVNKPDLVSNQGKTIKQDVFIKQNMAIQSLWKLAFFLLLILSLQPGAAADNHNLLLSQSEINGAGSEVVTPHIRTQLFSEYSAISPGQRFWVALRQQIIPGWHTYWRNPGDSGEPTAMDWELPPGWQASAIYWPFPSRLPLGPLVNFGYSNEVWLLTELQAPANLSIGQSLQLTANGFWLVCEEVCIPEEGVLYLPLQVTDSPEPSAFQQVIELAVDNLPKPFAGRVGYALTGGDLQLVFNNPRSDHPAKVEFFPHFSDVIEHAAPQKLSVEKDQLLLQIPSQFAAQPDRLDGVLVFTPAANSAMPTQGYQLSTHQLQAISVANANGTGLSLGMVLLMAMAGGLMLNLMPCVFPVLSIKILSLVKLNAGSAAIATSTGSEASSTAKAAKLSEPSPLIHGLIYAAGVLLGFALLAAALLTLRAAGAAIGWGFQLQNPVLVLVLVWLFFLLGLNLSGLFELGGRLAGTGQQLVDGQGYRQAFFTGLLATIVATPCTAPFMGAALGYALVQPAWLAMLIFLALGAGMALPFVLLCAFPRGLQLLPKPGAWMQSFKEILSIPMFLTAAWLLWVLVKQVGADAVLMATTGGLAIVSLIWLTKIRPSKLRLPGQMMAVGLLAGSLAVLPISTEKNASADSLWQNYSPEALTEARNKGPVLVNVTADWCITCKANEQIALGTERVMQLFKEKQVSLLEADWTRRDAEITQLLDQFQRSGVPLYLWYSGLNEDASSTDQPEILPQLLTESMLIKRLMQLP